MYPSDKTHSKLISAATDKTPLDVFLENGPKSCADYVCDKVYIGNKNDDFSKEEMVETSSNILIRYVLDVLAIHKILFLCKLQPKENLTPQNIGGNDAMSYLMSANKRIVFPNKKSIEWQR